jgi:hypothetical protein
MHKLKILWLALLVIVFLASAQSRDVGQGVIQGFVLGEGGQPVGGAKVHAELKGGPAMKAIRYVETDESGFFLIDRLDFGSYYIGAMKEEDGYGSIDSSFFNDNPIPTAQISVRYRFADLVVNLGVKAGMLTGKISDALTGKPIPAGFDLVQVKDPTSGWELQRGQVFEC